MQFGWTTINIMCNSSSYDRLGRDVHEFTVRAIDDACNVEEDEFT